MLYAFISLLLFGIVVFTQGQNGIEIFIISTFFHVFISVIPDSNSTFDLEINENKENISSTTTLRPFQRVIIIFDSWFVGCIAFLIIGIMLVSILMMMEYFKRNDREFLLYDDDNTNYQCATNSPNSPLYDSD